MKIISCICCFAICGVLCAKSIAPKVKPLTQEEMGLWIGRIYVDTEIPKSIILRGLVSDQTGLRVDCAKYLATHGSLSDIPHLVEKLSDQTIHVGADYPYAGMATTRYWANVALISIAKVDFGFTWDDPMNKRRAAIEMWKNHWINIKSRLKR